MSTHLFHNDVMNIALVSYEFINGDISFNLKQIEKAMRAVSDRADLLCFGESFLQGFDSLSWNYDLDKKVAISRESSVMKQLCDLTVTYDTDLLLGYIEEADDRLYSSYVLIEDGKVSFNYRRISPGWKESFADEHYALGNGSEDFIYKGHKFRIALCGDLFDEPERFKTDATLIWPVYVNYDLDEWKNEEKEYAMQAKKVSNLTLMINSISKEPLSHGGAFIFKDGELFNDVIYDIENILIIGMEGE